MSSAVIPSDLAGYAAQAAQLTGLDSSVILSQWISENGWKVPGGYNFGNIMVPGTHTLKSYGSGSEGVQAYADFLKNNSNYVGVLETAGKTPEAQLRAIYTSPWDEGHYGGDGSRLVNVYNSVLNAEGQSGLVKVPTGSVGVSSGWLSGLGSMTQKQKLGIMGMAAGVLLLVAVSE